MSFEIEGGYPVEGEIKIAGSKNSALPIIISSLLSANPVHLLNIPKLRDIDTTISLLQNLGVKIQPSGNYLSIEAKNITHHQIDQDLVNQMRASILVLGPFLARFGEVEIALPGGCAIGERPINFHIDALKKMGAEIVIKDGVVHAKAKQLIGVEIDFKKVTVTGTANILMAGCLAKGETIIHNAAKEPEVIDLINLLNQRGAKIKVIGSKIVIKGVSKLSEIEYSIIPDRIEAATYLSAAALTFGKLTAIGARWQDLEAFIRSLQSTGFQLDKSDGLITIYPLRKSAFKSTHIQTAPFPDFATDLQAIYSVIQCYAIGMSSIEENIFENRFSYLKELLKMGAQFKLTGQKVLITGVQSLFAADLYAPDLRAGAALVLAGLSAIGTSRVHHSYHIERGYERLDEKLTALGAKIKKV